jgi:ribosomal protein L44E
VNLAIFSTVQPPMSNRQLTAEELLAKFRPLYERTVAELTQIAAGDVGLFWALRRKLSKELSYSERGKPAQRKVLKAKKFKQQAGLCTICKQELPKRGAVLDRFEAMEGYTLANTRLLCPVCDSKTQQERNYK